MRTAVHHPSQLNAVLFGILGFLMLGVAIGGIGYRNYVLKSQPGQIIDSQGDPDQGFRAFHNDVYFPARAFLTGVNPYTKEYAEYHPDGLSFGNYTPSHLLINAGFGLLTLKVSEVAYAISNLVIVLIVVGLLFRLCGRSVSFGGVALVSGLVLISKPGLLNFFGLQMTMVHVLGCLLALEYAKRNIMLSGFGLLLAASNWTFVLPLGLLMICRRNLAAVVCGLLMVMAAMAFVLAILSPDTDSFDSTLKLTSRQFINAHRTEPIAKLELERIDVFSTIPKLHETARNRPMALAELLGRKVEDVNAETDLPISIWQDQLLKLPAERVLPWMLLLIAGLVTMFEANQDQRNGVLSRTGLFAILITLLAMQHYLNDALMLWIPVVGIALGSQRLAIAFSMPFRWLLFLLLLVPLFNFVGTDIALQKLGWVADSTEWMLAVTIDTLAIGLAALLVGLRILVSPLSKKDRNAVASD